MKTLFKKWKWLSYLEGGLIMLVGILTCIFFNNADFHNAIGYIFATYILINAVISLVAAVVYRLPIFDGDFIVGLLLLAFGIWIMIYPGVLVDSLPLIIGVVLIGMGLVELVKSLIVHDVTKVWIVNLIFAIVFLALGVTIIVLQYATNSDVKSFILLVAGILVTICGLFIIIDTLTVSKNAHDVKKVVKEVNKDNNVVIDEKGEEKK
ncbi:MAG: DUF308 domain-containing protein [Bacilli bacterium]